MAGGSGPVTAGRGILEPLRVSGVGYPERCFEISKSLRDPGWGLTSPYSFAEELLIDREGNLVGLQVEADERLTLTAF